MPAKHTLRDTDGKVLIQNIKTVTNEVAVEKMDDSNNPSETDNEYNVYFSTMKKKPSKIMRIGSGTRK